MVMTLAKITGNGYEYLLRHTAHGDTDPPARGQDPASYYTAAGNPPGRWTGRGTTQLGLQEGQEVTEDQMRALFGLGAHPDADQMITAYIDKHTRADMTARQMRKLVDDAISHVTLGRPFPAYKPLSPYKDRVDKRLKEITKQTGRAPTPAEISKVKASESRRQRTAVAGFDLVFSPVKSAALLWAIDDRQSVRDAIRNAHQQAVKEALDFIEDHAALTRTGAGGVAQIDTKGLTAAAFEHWDSRAGDPNLHTHVAVSSKVQGTDGKWRSLDARGLYRLTVAASELYNTALENHLSAALGVTFTPRPDTKHGKEPIREIAGIPQQMIDFFSQRRAAIEGKYAQLARDYRDKHGHDPDLASSHKLAQQATLATRAGKKPPVTLPAKRARWRDELTARFGPAAIKTLQNAVPATVLDQVRPVSPDFHDYAERIIATVAAHRSTWTRWNVHAEAERLLRAEVPSLPPDQHRDLAERLVTLALSPQHSISIEAPSLLNEPLELRRADGESVFTQHGAERFTCQAVLDAEQRLLNAVGTPTVSGLATARTAAALDGFEAVTGTKLDPGQRALVTAFATDDRLLLAGIGPAGAGKTTAMRAYAHVLGEAGRRLIPLGTSAASADILGSELSLPAENLHKFVYEWTSGRAAARLRNGDSVPADLRRFALHPGDAVLLDEAGMAGTFLLDELVSIATAKGTIVRLLGDHRQLSAVESGGALRLIASEPGTPELTALHRFRNPEEAAATLQLRTGNPLALDWYTANGRIRSGSRDAMTTAAYDGWKADMLAGKTTMMAAADGADVTELSARARADRVAAGQVEPGGVTLRDGNLAGAGDWIITRQNDRRLSACGGKDWIKNGDSWTVEQRHSNGALTVRSMTHSGRVTLPPGYVTAHVQLLYASTAHRVQGGTVDTAHPLITPGMSRETLYVLASRAREHTTFYVATHDLPFDDDAHLDQAATDPDAYAAREILTNILATEGTALSATETIATAQEEAESLATLVPRYLHAAHQLAERRYRTAVNAVLGGTRAYLVTRDPAWGAVVRRLYDAEASGWEPMQLLKTASQMRELETADSIAEVLTWRIDTIRADTSEPSPNGIQTPAPDQKTPPLPAPPEKRAVLPWLTGPQPDRTANGGLPAYLNDAANLITTRISELADRAIREHPAWLTTLGQQPVDTEQRNQWRHHVAIIAAYRDQHQVTTNDPRQILGPYPEPAHSAHTPYRHAAESVHAARRIAGLDQTPPKHHPADGKLATDIYSKPRSTTMRPGTRPSRDTRPRPAPQVMTPPPSPGPGPAAPVQRH